MVIFLGYIDPGTGFTIFSIGGWLIAALLGFAGALFFLFKKTFGFIKKRRRLFLAILTIVTALLIIKGVFMGRGGSRFDKKVIILGFDGLSPEIIEPMMQAGELPSFSKLKEQGSYCRFSTSNPSQSPVAWAAFSTGKNPGKNGIYDFIIRDPKTYALTLSLSDIKSNRPKPVIKSKRLWQYASAYKVPSVIITCPVTFPPDKLYGRMLAGMGVPDILGTEGTFTFYTSEKLDRQKDTGGKVFHVSKSPEMLLNLIGPRAAALKNAGKNVKVPFKVVIQKEKNKILIEYQNNKFELKEGQWSPWQEVTFQLGLFRKIKGIFKFYLAEIEPELKLYVSPINFDPRKPFFRISYPGKYSRELAEDIGLYYTQGMPMDTWAVNEGRLDEKAFLEIVNEVLREKEQILELELRRFDRGLLFCYFESPDIIQHMFWRYTDSRHPLYEESAPQEYKEMIRGWYKRMDRILGGVLEKLGSEDALIILSDHGFDTFRRAAHINSWLRANGYLELLDQNAESGAELLKDIDWSRTRAYAIGFGAIYINQQDREGKGIVRPGGESERLKQELSEKLERWFDKKFNSRVINKVYKKEEIFWGDYAAECPDLYIGFNKGYRASWQTALGAVPAELIEDNLKKWSGSHLFDPALIPGVLFSNKKITKENPGIMDVTPTVLKIIGYDEEELQRRDFDGGNLFE